MTKRPKRTRTVRREADRDASKLVRDAHKVDEASVGGSADRPIELASPSQVEIDAESRPCPACGGRLRASPHEVVSHGGERLRVAGVVCIDCREHWKRFYRLGPVLN
jgi:hypothetical protein